MYEVKNLDSSSRSGIPIKSFNPSSPECSYLENKRAVDYL